MIPVRPQPEPPNFEVKVRQPGQRWLRDHGIPLGSPPPVAGELPNYWSCTQRELWEAYAGTCAYLSIYFHFGSGASSTDHFIPKSRNAGQAYEWSNYRLSCLAPNRSKSNFEDILDPFEISPNTFFLNFISGKILPNPDLDPAVIQLAERTIDSLGLNAPENCQMRTTSYDEYLAGVPEWKLKKDSPFVWYEASRQGFLMTDSERSEFARRFNFIPRGL